MAVRRKPLSARVISTLRAKAKTRKEKKVILEEHKTNNVFRFVLQGTFDPNIKWNTPKKLPKESFGQYSS